MVATPATATIRYIRPGITKVYWVPTIANPSSPTRAELDAGTDLSPEVADVSGFVTNSDSAEAPDLGSRFTPKVNGMITADDSSINVYASSDSADLRTLLIRDTVGFVVWLDGGDVPTQLMDVYPVTIASSSQVRSMTDPAQIAVSFTITSEPSEGVAIPAAV